MLDLNLEFNSLLKNLKKNQEAFSVLKIAVLADFASQYIAKALQAVAVDHAIKLEVWEANYDAVAATVYNNESPLFTEVFSYIIIFQSSRKLYKEYSNEKDKPGFSLRKAASIDSLLATLKQRTKAKIILSNFHEFDDAVFGNYASKTAHSFLYQLRSLNVRLMDLAIKEPDVFIADLQSMAAQKGAEATFNATLYIHADLIYDLDFIALAAQKTFQIILANEGNFKKCIILDLDNTLWGGIIGDDGLEHIQIGDLGLGKAFANLQLWLRNLKDRGIILAVCSKNNEDLAKEVFLKHPAMALRLEDISVFVANWETKVDNIIFIQTVLNIGFDSMVFIDDNPFERAMVKQHLPAVTVPQLPKDPAEYLPYLQSLSLFETASFTTADNERTKQYQEEAQRGSLQNKFVSENEFLESLSMKAEVKPADAFTAPRVAQLSQRSNQFNLRTVRYSEEQIKKIITDPDKIILTVSMSDVFGDYGLISAVILEKQMPDLLFINTWIMSCRVLKRGVENLLLNEIVSHSASQGIKTLVGEYLPTPKNALVKDHYAKLGFAAKGDFWMLDIENYQPKKTHVVKANRNEIYH